MKDLYSNFIAVIVVINLKNYLAVFKYELNFPHLIDCCIKWDRDELSMRLRLTQVPLPTLV